MKQTFLLFCAMLLFQSCFEIKITCMKEEYNGSETKFTMTDSFYRLTAKNSFWIYFNRKKQKTIPANILIKEENSDMQESQFFTFPLYLWASYEQFRKKFMSQKIPQKNDKIKEQIKKNIKTMKLIQNIFHFMNITNNKIIFNANLFLKVWPRRNKTMEFSPSGKKLINNLLDFFDLYLKPEVKKEIEFDSKCELLKNMDINIKKIEENITCKPGSDLDSGEEKEIIEAENSLVLFFKALFSIEQIKQIKREIVRGLAHRKKIHLQVRPEYIRLVADDLMLLIEKNELCNRYITSFKIRNKHFTFLEEIKKDANARSPIIVIYPCFLDPRNKEHTDIWNELLQIILEKYKDFTNHLDFKIAPRSNKEYYKGFMYIAEGEGLIKYLYKVTPNYVQFKNTVYTPDYAFFNPEYYQ